MSDIERITELVGSKEFEKAKELIYEVIEKYENNQEMLKLAGLTEVNLKNWEAAKKHFEKVVNMSPDDATSQFYYAVCNEKTGDLTGAKNAYIKVLELRDEYYAAYKSLCMVLMNLKEPEGAIEWAKKALEHNSEGF